MIFLETLQDLKFLLAMEISSPLTMAKDLYDIGVLPKQSYLAVTKFIATTIKANYALVNLLFDELVDPPTLDKFEDYCRIELPRSYEVLTSMGEYYHDNFLY